MIRAWGWEVSAVARVWEGLKKPDHDGSGLVGSAEKFAFF